MKTAANYKEQSFILTRFLKSLTKWLLSMTGRGAFQVK